MGRLFWWRVLRCALPAIHHKLGSYRKSLPVKVTSKSYSNRMESEI